VTYLAESRNIKRSEIGKCTVASTGLEAYENSERVSKCD
jgi:hypothetical protein